MTLFIYTIISLIASIQDIKTREVSNIIHILIIFIALPNITINKIIGALIGLTVFFIPNLVKKDGIGGADIKFMFASGLILGTEKIIIATITSMIVAIIYAVLKKSILNHDLKVIPLIPFLFIGCVSSYFI
ncbi:Flp pilus assembly protein%2C protease CpaA [uncultured Clostridium sp.]|nr:Flp pilus assembly protein%2C protease CpaA [uncultured Clostridium sp.]SCJ45441.1 Flp pilus assembly protein%2C protease CpaA [uncultured Clostridium sp.]